MIVSAYVTNSSLLKGLYLMNGSCTVEARHYLHVIGARQSGALLFILLIILRYINTSL